jgi:glycosyltransferase involved in cell wall biosynthesis
MSIIEAYSVGTPVICSGLGNAGSIVEEGVTGWKFPTGSARGLADKVLQWSDLSESVKAVYDEKYTAEENYRLYNSILCRAGI